METLYIQVKSKKDAEFIQELLKRLKGVRDFGVIKNKRILDFVEELEDEQDIKAIEEAGLLDGPTISFAELEEIMKKSGKIK